jgi:hypothetical protein
VEEVVATGRQKAGDDECVGWGGRRVGRRGLMKHEQQLATRSKHGILVPHPYYLVSVECRLSFYTFPIGMDEDLLPA